MKTEVGRLKVTEIFFSLQGESVRVGLPTVFVRLTGCPLRCRYCDTAYAFSGGEWMTVDVILSEVKKYNTRQVLLTGGEPLAQKTAIDLLSRLCDEGYQVSLETSGAISMEGVDSRVMKVMDVKTPSSGEQAKNRYENFEFLDSTDQIKFVIADEADYQWSRQLIEDRCLHERCEVLFSPVHTDLAEHELADWILRDQLPVRFQFQLHKFLWGDKPGV